MLSYNIKYLYKEDKIALRYPLLREIFQIDQTQSIHDCFNSIVK